MSDISGEWKSKIRVLAREFSFYGTFGLQCAVFCLTHLFFVNIWGTKFLLSLLIRKLIVSNQALFLQSSFDYNYNYRLCLQKATVYVRTPIYKFEMDRVQSITSDK
jgi:hypothetical protein